MFVPSGTKLTNQINLQNLKYRKSLLNIKISGIGMKIKSFKINGNKSSPFIKKDLIGLQCIEIELNWIECSFFIIKTVMKTKYLDKIGIIELEQQFIDLLKKH